MPDQVTDTSSTFAERLNALLADQRIGSGRLAALSNIDVRLICKYRSGRVVPRDAFGWPTTNAAKLARALGVAVEDLVPPRKNLAA